MKTIPMLLCDFYKTSHIDQYPEGTQVVYSTWTPRESKKENINKVVAFGFQAFIKKYLIEYFNEHFFKRDINTIITEYKRVISNALNIENPRTSHIEDLHKLGYLPIEIKALPEGTRVPIRVPMLTIQNTDYNFFWITNFIETLMSCELWSPSTSATISYQYKEILTKYALETDGNLDFVNFQGHDFSMRGMNSVEASALSGAGHLLNFYGTDTIPAICFLEKYYNANIETELVGTSIPATEHSVMCAYGKEHEKDAYKELITNRYPSGFLSIVSDTWNLWETLEDIIKPLKQDILNRDGKIVIRPDSGNPVDIICGNINGATEFERKGVIEVLWDIFGGTITEKGYKKLDSHIGCIYGDSITVDRCIEICKRLKAKGFASTNIVYGIGSYTYQYQTRDIFGFALKSTFAQINGVVNMLYKDPVTDINGVKKSQKGKVAVIHDEYGELTLVDNLTVDNYPDDQLKTIFLNGQLVIETSLKEIRDRLKYV